MTTAAAGALALALALAVQTALTGGKAGPAVAHPAVSDVRPAVSAAADLAAADRSVSVPDAITSGSLEVMRQDPRISVSYFDPAGRKVPAAPAGTLGGQTFALAGFDGPVEALTVGDPLPGRWRVHLVAGPGVPPGVLEAASALWLGVLHSAFTLIPPGPRPGQQVTVSAKVQVGGRAIRPSDLAGLQVSVRVVGVGLAAPIIVPVTDNGVAPDLRAHDGVYSGTLMLPRSASGRLFAVGQVVADGGVDDVRSTPITINTTVL